MDDVKDRVELYRTMMGMKTTPSSPTYSHRNGETEPPTIYGTDYWFRCNNKDDPDDGPEDGLVFLYDRDEPEFTDALGDRYSLNDVSGQWWGPVTPPWENSSV